MRASSTPEGAGTETNPDLGAGCAAPRFKAEAHRQSLAVARSRQANEDQAFIDDVSDLCLDESLE